MEDHFFGGTFRKHRRFLTFRANIGASIKWSDMKLSETYSMINFLQVDTNVGEGATFAPPRQMRIAQSHAKENMEVGIDLIMHTKFPISVQPLFPVEARHRKGWLNCQVEIIKKKTGIT